MVSPSAQTNTASIGHSDELDPDLGNNTAFASETPLLPPLPPPNQGGTDAGLISASRLLAAASVPQAVLQQPAGPIGPVAFDQLLVTFAMRSTTGPAYFGQPLETGSLSGYAYHDLDMSAGLDPDEPGLAGVRVTLRGTAPSGRQVEWTERTDSDGFYEFLNLSAGFYELTVEPLTGYLATGPTVGRMNGVLDGNRGNMRTIEGVRVPVGGKGRRYDFGEVKMARLSGMVYLNRNGNGRPDPGNIGLTGVRVTLTGRDRSGSVVRRNTRTDRDGMYLFADLPPGTYAVNVAVPDGHASVRSSAGNVDGRPSGQGNGGSVQAVVLPPDGAGADYDFGAVPADVPGR